MSLQIRRAATWSAVAERAFGPGASPGGLRIGESLIVPEIDFVLEHRFSELKGVRVMNDGPPGMPIARVLQDLRLRLDEEGVVIRSRTIVTVGSAIAEKPRRFVCDGPFLVALIEEGAKSPWLLAWITDPEVLIAE